MPKILFTFAAIVGATLLGSGPSTAVEGRYCAVVFNGEGAVKEICHFNSFEACRLEVVNGNRPIRAVQLDLRARLERTLGKQVIADDAHASNGRGDAP